MASKKQTQYENNLKQLGSFIESLYYKDLNSPDFKVVRDRFIQLFPEFAIVDEHEANDILQEQENGYNHSRGL